MTSCHQHWVWKPHWMKDWLFFCFLFFFASMATATYRQWPPHCHYSLPSVQQLTGLTLFISQRHPWKTKTEKGTSPAARPDSSPFSCLSQPAQSLLAKSSLRACRAHLKQVPSAMFSNNNGYRESVSVLLRNGPGQHLLFETVVFASSNTASVWAGGWNWLEGWETLIMWDLKTVFFILLIE